jgi:acetyl esterase
MRLDRRLRAFLWFAGVTGATDVSGGTPEKLARLRAQKPPRSPLARRLSDWLVGPVAPGVAITDRQVPGRDGPVTVRLYRPYAAGDTPPVVVVLHGGGWALGNLDSNDPLASRVAAGTGAVVVSVDYRLAPEHPYPAALHDVIDVLGWVADSGAELAADPTRLAIMGDSAGANLAAAACLWLRDTGAGPRIAQQVLLYPAVDALAETAGPPGAETSMLRASDARQFLTWYLGEHGDPTDPYVSPLRAASLAGLPAALVITAEHDLLRETGTRFARRLAGAGVPTRHTDYVGMMHGFFSLPGVCRSSPQAEAEVCRVLRAALAPVGADPEAAVVNHGL